MKIYHYDGITKEFIRESEAREDPLEPGRFLIPANATATAPPKIKSANKVNIFVEKNKKWKTMKDYRGYIFYDTNFNRKGNPLPEEILNFGETIPKFATEVAPTKDFYRARWNANKSEWVEDSLIFEGQEVSSKLDVDMITREKIVSLGEAKAKTELLEACINLKQQPKSWIEFMKLRKIILKEGEDFIKKNNLE